MNYIKLPSDIFEHDALQALRCRFGVGADAFALRLYFAICKRGYYLRWDECLKWKSTQWLPNVFEIDTVQCLVEKLTEWGFFDRKLFYEMGILTNLNIQLDYFRSKSHRKNIESLTFILPEVRNKYFPATTDTVNPEIPEISENSIVNENSEYSEDVDNLNTTENFDIGECLDYSDTSYCTSDDTPDDTSDNISDCSDNNYNFEDHKNSVKPDDSNDKSKFLKRPAKPKPLSKKYHKVKFGKLIKKTTRHQKIGVGPPENYKLR